LKKDFYAYDVLAGSYVSGKGLVPTDSDEPDRILLFGGKGYKFAEPTGKVYTFQLSNDLLQGGAAGPFASAATSPVSGTGATSPLLLLEHDGGAEDTSRAVWLQTTLVVNTDEESESFGQSFINIALGEWSTTSGLSGARRGGSDLDDAYSFSGDIASLAGPDKSHFLGKNSPNLVVGFDSTGSHKIGLDTPLNPIEGENDTVQNQAGSTYHIGVGTGTTVPEEQHTGTFTGYAAGFVQQPGDGAPVSLVSNSPNNVTLSLDAATNTMSASLHVGNGMLLPNQRYNLEFGGEGNSAFIDDDIFAAFEKPGESGVQEDERYGFLGLRKRTHTYEADAQGYFVSADAINANEILFPKGPDDSFQKRAFCQDCNYIKWGAWGTRLGYEDYKGQPVTEDVHLGWWIAGDVVSSSDIPTTGKAYYEGDAIGTVASKQGGAWNQYVATGGMNMNWDFAKRLGLLKIENFDNRNFAGIMLAPGKAQFGGVLAGSGVAGTATGAFVGPNVVGGVRDAPHGVIGNFDVGNKTWKADGIFGGTRVRN